MCRFALYLGPEITLDLLATRPKHSIVHQSFHARERSEPLNGDGFGLGWYVPDLSNEAAIFKSVSPAWSNVNLRHLARVTRSNCILAHVRAASPGIPVSELNCHPFSCDTLTFMHNGSLAGFPRLKRTIVNRLSDRSFDGLTGSTDSEHIFSLFCDRFKEIHMDDPADRLAATMTTVIAELENMRRAADISEFSYLNLAVTDGCNAVVSHFVSDSHVAPPSLYVHTGKSYTCEGNICRMIEPEGSGGAVLVASEPLSGDPGWDAVPPNSLLIIDSDRSVRYQNL